MSAFIAFEYFFDKNYFFEYFFENFFETFGMIKPLWKITAIELVVGKLCQMYVLIKISQWEADELSRLTRAPQNGPTIGFSHRLGN